MFVFHPGIKFSLHDYGIHVPMLNQRVEQITTWVEGNIAKKYLDSKLWFGQDFSPIRKSLLLSAHTEKYIEHSFNNPEDAIQKTFELIDENGNLNRYDPDIAKYPLTHLHLSIQKHMQGSLESCHQAIETGFSFYLGGGLHHAMSFGGRGFCHYNDIALNAFSLIEIGYKNIWIIDIDAHKGDGTAEIFYENKNVHTFSIHQKSFWPLDSERLDIEGNLNPWFIPSDLDVPVGIEDNRNYNQLLRSGLEDFKTKFPNPDFIMVVSGSDPYELDALESAGEINLTLEEMGERDRFVYEFCLDQKVPIQYMISGGYGEHAHKVYIQFLSYLKKKNQWT